jgi:hypothetical protein
MYQVIYDKDDGLWWIVKDGKALTDLGGFIEPVTPRIIIQEIENEL